MLYADQSRALSRLDRIRAAAAFVFSTPAAIVLIAGWPHVGLAGSLLGSLLAVVTIAAAGYLPLYLGLTVERRKRFSWPVRFRIVAAPLLALLALPLCTSYSRLLAWLGCLAIAAIAVLSARRALKRHADADSIPLLPLELLVGDIAVVLIVSSQSPRAATIGAVGLSLAAVLFLVSAEGRARWYGIAVVALAFVCLPAHDASLPVWVVAVSGAMLVGAAAGTQLLMAECTRHHCANVAATVEELTAFDSVTAEHAEEMLATATGILARSWNANPPADSEAVGRWYEANSAYYLYDLAQFHLAYKHIRFMLDILSLSKGRVLDYGAGIGDLSLELARRGHDITYLDVEGRTKAFARWRAERDWLEVAFASEIGEAPGPFDTIVSLDVFEHLSDPLPVVDALVERLAPGGRMIVTAYFGATKSHPMHFDHDIDLGAYLRAAGLVDRKSFAMKHLRSQFLGKRGVLVFEKPA